MKKIRIITIIVFIAFLCLLGFELFRNWDDSYTKDNEIQIIVYSALSSLVIVFYFFIPKVYVLIKPYLKNKEISINDEYIRVSEMNKTKNIIIICISAIICCLILGYSYYVSNKYELGGDYRMVIIDKYNNSYTIPIKE